MTLAEMARVKMEGKHRFSLGYPSRIFGTAANSVSSVVSGRKHMLAIYEAGHEFDFSLEACFSVVTYRSL